MARWKTAMLLALLISGVISCDRPPAEKVQTNAAGNPEVSKPSLAPEYFQMVQTLADRDNRTLKKMFVTDSLGKIVEVPNKATQSPPVRFRAPTTAEIGKMGPFWPTVPPEKNAAYYFVKAILEQADAKDAPAGSSVVPLKPYGGDVEALAKWVERNRPFLEAMREGMKQDFYCMPLAIIEEYGVPAPPLSSFLSGLEQVARDLTDEGFLEEVKGNPARAASNYLECVRFGKKFHNATVIECLVGVSAQRKGQTALDSLVANATLSDETLRAVIVSCREAEVDQDVPARILATDSALVETTMALLKPHWRKDGAMLRSLKSQEALKDFAARKSLDELLQYKVLEAAFENELKESVDKETQEILPRTFAELGGINVRLRATQIRAAIVLYRRVNGRFPDSLDALCPNILPSVPADPFFRKPMQYAKTSGGWKLSSFNISFTEQAQSNIEHWSRGAIKSLPAPAAKQTDPAAAGK